MVRDRLTSQENLLLWDEFRSGDPEAFSRIYELFSADLYRYGYNLVRNKQLVEDCLHELFLHIYNSRQRIGPTDNIRFYMYRALRRRLTDALVRLKKLDSQAYIFESAEFLVESYETELVEQQTLDHQRQIVIAELNRLPKRQREILYLVFMKGLTYSQAAEVMNITMKSVYNTIHVALSALRTSVAERFDREWVFINVTIVALMGYLAALY
ncbi:sigma-70 family RNA polymerase sigma factor [Dyadobacter sp. CY261]|uniref:RNA polymerase sigma factor n=1 Tax=Dyadobacter sp. CY261 TaxID=2907203 RepID=UPI001F1FF0F3|nr:sigma-70 family RNA polymerase sigma factor [Dyadobacter sp. CY261]MCF0069703.1 sigma-70 family RNA polymerase sigma factor [Dyadobacter sp. CY261]